MVLKICSLSLSRIIIAFNLGSMQRNLNRSPVPCAISTERLRSAWLKRKSVTMTIVWIKHPCMGYDTTTGAVNRKLPAPRKPVGYEEVVAEVVGIFAAEFKRATGLPPIRRLHSLNPIKQLWTPPMLLKKPFRKVVFGTPLDLIVSTDPMAGAGAKFVKGADFIPLRISLDMRDLGADTRTTRIL